MSGPAPSLPRRVVVKLGTGVLTTGIGRIDEARVSSICAQIAALRARGLEVIVVSSGAVGLGMGALGLARRPREVARKQACAAIGQSLLMQVWQRGFAPHGLVAAQVLLTHDDLRVRARHLGVKACLEEILSYRAVPVINENDTVSAAEIRFGDNDTLSALVASLAEAQHLIILSTAPGLIDMRGTGQVVPVVEKITPQIEAMAGGTTSETAVGGMVSKISAAKLATRAGCGVFIASGAEPDIVPRLLEGRGPGTFFVPSGLPMESRKRWMAHFQRPKATLRLDAGAAEAVRERGRSLLASGVAAIEGEFLSGEIVNLAGPDGVVFARGAVSFSSDELARIRGRSTAEIRSLLPGHKRCEAVHRDSLALLN